MAGQDPSEIDSADSTSIPGKAKDEKTYAPYPQLQALVKGAPDELMSKPRWQRALISFAGPLVNLIFPIFLLAGVYFFKGGANRPYLALPFQWVAFLATASTSPDGCRVVSKEV